MDLLGAYSDDDTDDDEISPKVCGSESSSCANFLEPCHEKDQGFNTDSLPQHSQLLLQVVHSTLTSDNANVGDTSGGNSSQIEQSTAICYLPTILQSQNTATTAETSAESSSKSSTKENSFNCATTRASLCSDSLTSTSSLKDEFSAPHGSSVVDYFNLCADLDNDSVENGAMMPGGSSNSKSSNAKACNERLSADFWNTTSPLCNWGQCERIWGVPSDAVETCPSVSTIESTTADSQWKRRKLIKDSQQADYPTTESVKLKPCFVLHHKVAPHLQDARLKKIVCRCPKKLMAVLLYQLMMDLTVVGVALV